MNLLKNIFEAYEAHDFGLLDSYLHLILSQYIRNYAKPPTSSHPLADHFNIFQPSQLLTVKNNGDFFDMVYRSEDKKQENQLKDDDSKITLSRDLSPKILQKSHPDNSLSRKLDIKCEWLRSLGKVFTVLDSKAIKKLLLLLEHPKETTRKMIMLLFQVLLKKTQNKVHFVEKCAIGFSPGVYVVSRMKYVQLKFDDSLAVFQCLAGLKKFFKTAKSKLEIENKRMRGEFLSSPIFLLFNQKTAFFFIFCEKIEKEI